MPLSRGAIWLPAQLGSVARVCDVPRFEAHACRLLCVSTLEPRKNYRSLLAAFRSFVERRPDLDLQLVLVGNKYIGSDDLVDLIDEERAAGLPVEWLGVVTDDQLVEQYRRASFTVYPSLIEGFGLPIMESLWLGRPAVCSDTGVMAELAAGGGCLTVNVQSVSALSAALERLATDQALYEKLCQETQLRPLRGWAEFAMEVGDALHSVCVPQDCAKSVIGARWMYVRAPTWKWRCPFENNQSR